MLHMHNRSIPRQPSEGSLMLCVVQTTPFLEDNLNATHACVLHAGLRTLQLSLETNS